MLIIQTIQPLKNMSSVDTPYMMHLFSDVVKNGERF